MAVIRQENNACAEKHIMITGGAGTVGSTLLRHVLATDVDEVRVLDNNETELFYLTEAFRNDRRVRFFLGDIRDRDKLSSVSRGVDIIYHTAAYKHVILSEFNPFDVIQTNINGTENVIESALANNVKKVIFTSSDKAVNPTNVMGASKLMAEKLITAANTIRHDKQTIFASTRFGNVLGSRGSVVPIFMQQIAAGGPVTLTDADMTRFVMTIDDAVQLVIGSSELVCGGEVFVTKMPVIRIADLAAVMIRMLAPRFGHDPDAIPVQEIGKKPGEKVYEELMSNEEISRALELRSHFAILPAFRNLYPIDYSYREIIRDRVENPYVSAQEPCMTQDELERYLTEKKVLDGGLANGR